ncbi:Metallopeptidase, catalytic domain [Phytophthora cactorum]|nr:Metallopeptidase, catalytic domain [Phytophthora cactorum]
MLLYLNENELEIVSHEMDHGFGLPDFDQQPKPDNFKPYIMDAMTSSTVRDTDGWLLRRVLENKKHNYDF